MKSKTKKSLFINVWEIFWTVLSFLILVILGIKFIFFQQVTVVGKSMYPNYNDGELLLVNQINREFKRGQVVAVYADKNVAKDANYFTRFSAKFFLKRIIGLPGESIEIVGSKVIIYNSTNPSGSILGENYISQESKNSEEAREYYYPKTQIGSNKYFVMGDNRSNSTDSRSSSLGQISDYALFGYESIRFWPLENWKVFDAPTYTFTSIDEKTLQNRQTFSGDVVR